MHRYNFTNPVFLLKIEFMLHRFFILFSLLFLTTCDDGNIITVDLEFDRNLEYCDNNTDSFLIYDFRADPNESLSITIDRGTDQEFPFTVATPILTPTQFTIDGSTNRFIYRTYNRAIDGDELCDPIPPADLTIVEDYESLSGNIFVTVTIDDDDGDGIPSDLEGRDPNGDGDFSDAINSDASGPFPDDIPDYLDEDDDNDNVKTINEIDTDNADGDNDPTTNPLDTDGDGIPNYLDDDDDGDMTPTMREDENGDKDPRNDQNTNSDGILIPHYLNDLETMTYSFVGLIDENQYVRTVTASFLITDFSLEILSGEEIDFGTLTYPITIIQELED